MHIGRVNVPITFFDKLIVTYSIVILYQEPLSEGSKMSNYKKRLGNWGEGLAEEYLQENGICIIARNVFTPHGELDLIGRENADIVFFEVKTRTNLTFGYPEVSVNHRKQSHLVNSALFYMQNHPEERGYWRIDVIAIQKTSDAEKPIQIEWFKNAVQ